MIDARNNCRARVKFNCLENWTAHSKNAAPKNAMKKPSIASRILRSPTYCTHTRVEAALRSADSGCDRDLKDLFLAVARTLQGSDVAVDDAIGRTADLRDIGPQRGGNPWAEAAAARTARADAPGESKTAR